MQSPRPTPLRLKPLHEQVVVITGASSGIGLATVEAAVAKGARVVLVARNGAALDDIAVRLRATGGQVATLAADIADSDTAERIAELALDSFGRVDTWVNNAAASLYGRFDQVPEADHRRIFEIGYFGTVRGSLKAVELLKTRGGALINVGSVLGDRAIQQQGMYCAMKHALRGFTDALRVEIAEAGQPVSVTLIKPHAIHTPYPEHARNYMEKPGSLPAPVYDPRLVAKAILFAAQHPRRMLTVGGLGVLVSTLGTIFPRLTDIGETLVGRAAQQTDAPPPPGVNDNLYAPRRDGRIDSDQDKVVRRTSLWLDAQMYPVRAAGAVGAAVVLAAMLAGARRQA